MINLLGNAALGIGTAGAVTATAAWILAGHRTRWRRPARWMTLVTGAAATVAFLTLVWAMLADDFSVAYVAEHGQRALPPLYKVLAVWSAKEGSFLLWLLVLNAYFVGTALLRPSGAASTLHAPATSVIAAVTVAFFLLVTAAANPFGAVDPVPADGLGPNPLLQDHWLMAVHPPMLYLGYLGFTVPFAWAIAALITGRTGKQWLAPVRRWALLAWTALTVGIILGAWWGYEVLGWGGYWAWDPVENASLLPWLTATALLHAMVVQQRRATLRVWSLVLACATFLLVLVGTFLTRSGVISSVHSFTQSALGPMLLGMVVATAVGAGLLFIWRSDRLGPDAPLGARVSRESLFVANNTLLVILALVVLFGTVFPVFAEALAEQRITVGAPFFNRMAIPLALSLIVLMGVGPALSWGAVEPGEWKRLRAPAIVGALVAAGLGLAGVGSVTAVVTFAAAAFAGVATAGRIGAGLWAGHTPASPWWVGVYGALRRDTRYYGGLLAHLGVVMGAVAIAGSSLAVETEQELAVGDEISVGSVSAVLRSLHEESSPRRESLVADLEVRRGDRVLDEVTTRLSQYPNAPQAVAAAAVVSRPRGDVYVQLTGTDDARRHAGVQLAWNPLMPWLWLSAAVMAAGAGLAAWKPRRRASPATAATSRRRPHDVAP